MDQRENKGIIARPPPPLFKVPLIIWLSIVLFLVAVALARLAG